jgi:hypothetical protein
VLLLLVLALLSMFGLIAVAFVVLTGHAQRGAKSIERLGQAESLTDSSSATLLHQAAMQILRGPNTTTAGVPNPASVMGAHSLLEDMYGNGFLLGQLTAGAQQFTDGAGHKIPQLLQLTTNLAAATSAQSCGCVLTITGPTAATPGYGQSTRIVSVDPNSGAIYVTAFPDGSLPPATATFTVNGVPFGGMGFGYNSLTQAMELMYNSATPGIDTTKKMSDASTTIWPVALLPNLPLSAYSAFGYNPPGGVNVEYTAPDFQHMLLAAQVPNTAVASGVQTLPSFHRPALCRYWANNTNGLNFSLTATDFSAPPSPTTTLTTKWKGLTPANVALLRQIMLRPIGQFTSFVTTTTNLDHPNFTGSNPNFNPFWDGVTAGAGQWDVDNDGDGVPDSVWVDLGMPIRATADGHLYKPLFAILCVDLDGRLNLNAHGNIAQTDTTATGRFNANGTPTVANASSDVGTGAQGSGFLFAGGGSTAQLARGQGYGPAEITLAPLFTSLAQYQQLMAGNATSQIDGRYAEVNLGVDGNGRPKQQAGFYGNENPLSRNKWYQFDSPAFASNWSWWNFQTVTAASQYSSSDASNSPDGFGSPPDTFGVGAVGLDPAGRPLYLAMGGQTQNNPYELNLASNIGHGLSSPTAAADNPFSPSELERILRPFDRDAPTLPGRLATLAPNLVPPTGSASKRLSATTESWDVPVTTPPIMTVLNGRTDMLYGNNVNRIPATKWNSLFAPELLAGLKMDVTRPLGYWNYGPNGALTLFSKPGITWPTAATAPNFSPDGTVVSPLQARQWYARYLYVLGLLFDDQYWAALKAGSTTTVQAIAQYTAQWAVNMVDFQSRDSVITPFKYDSNTFAPSISATSNWAADETDLVNPTVNDRTVRPGGDCWVVWGCKRPELLITETLAFHDRRTQDLPGDNGIGTTTTGTPADPTFDQQLRPQGSLFVELYNPGTILEAPPTDLYTFVTTSEWGVNLDRLTPGGNPVWRMLIVDKPKAVTGGVATDPDDPHTSARPVVEREVYFANGNVGGTSVVLPLPSSFCKLQYRPASALANQIAPILPSRYALIGPGAAPGGTPGKTYIGGGATPTASTPFISLAPNPNPDSPTSQVTASATSAALPNANARNAVAVLIQEPWLSNPLQPRLSVSEPTGGYPASVPATLGSALGPAVYQPSSDSYSPPADTPLDTDTATMTLKTTKFSPGVKKIYLQRLADPTKDYNPDNISDPNYSATKVVNPYRTIDAMPIDLQAFNGAANKDPNDPNDPTKFTAGPNPGVYFHSRQRGDTNGASTNMNLWRAEDPLLTQLTFPPATYDSQNPTLAATEIFPYQLQHSLTFLNTSFGAPSSTPAAYRGDPQSPFPWLTWPRRPLASPLESLLVPAVSSSQLLSAFNVAQGGNPYTPAVARFAPTTAFPFPHLAPFFQSQSVSAGDTNQTPGFYRVLDYLGVPSRFVGTDIQIDPGTAATASGHLFHPPFNRISTYREPGRINLNTIYTPETWQGLMSSFSANMASSTSFNNFIISRRGYGATNGVLDMDPNTKFPTEFGRPFRSPGLAQRMVPKLATDTLTPSRETDATVLRADSTGLAPLFQYTSTGATAPDNTNQNPYFCYQAIQRLGNMVTTRSNVYAVWITVGYFEVTPAPTGYSTAIYPDGYQLGQELGSDTGEIQRHRAFYIFDRTIPVGFQRGQDLNVQNAILVKRFIE